MIRIRLRWRTRERTALAGMSPEEWDSHLGLLENEVGNVWSMEQALWPENNERIRREIENAPREADEPDSWWCSHEEAMRSVQERIAKVRNTPC